jgi:hypothetical protein
MPSVDRYSCSISTSGVTRVKPAANTRNAIAVSGSANPMTRRVASSTMTTATTA